MTFDDGYAGLLPHVKPVLERFGVPATAFVPSGFLGSRREFWWEELDALLLHASGLPPSLDLDLAGHRFRWRAKDRLGRLRRRCRRRPALTPAEDLYYKVAKRLQRGSTRDRSLALDRLAQWTTGDRQVREGRVPLSHSELRSLADGGLVEIGSHTVTHPVLAALGPAEQYEEIRSDRNALEQVLARPVTSFAYPYGGRSEYTAISVAAVREVGFRRACANVPGLAGPADDVFQLPRLIVRDCDGDAFTSWLEGWFVRGASRSPRRGKGASRR